MKVDKSVMRDEKNRYYTQGLFLEIAYSKYAIYTLKGEDHKHKGKTYPSIKKLYLEFEDPTEYECANKYFVDWNHWKAICNNKVLRRHIDQWREELELRIRSQAIRDIIGNSADGSYQASKYLADRGWDKNAVGRPNRNEKDKKDKMDAMLDDEFSQDIGRMGDILQ